MPSWWGTPQFAGGLRCGYWCVQIQCLGGQFRRVSAVRDSSDSEGCVSSHLHNLLWIGGTPLSG